MSAVSVLAAKRQSVDSNVIAANNSEQSNKLPLSVSTQFQLHSRQSLQRAEIEAYISEKFQTVYGASVSHFLPALIELQCDNIRSAACGFKDANSGKLYLENYLDIPIEQAISQATNSQTKRPIHRSNILEIGNLVSTWKGSSQMLFLFITVFAHNLGYEWVAFTATNEVKRLLDKMQLSVSVIAAAQAKDLGVAAKAWGSYYDTNPQVMIGHIPLSMSAIAQHCLVNALTADLMARMSMDVQVAVHQWRRHNLWND
jgi:hypothetical protein